MLQNRTFRIRLSGLISSSQLTLDCMEEHEQPAVPEGAQQRSDLNVLYNVMTSIEQRVGGGEGIVGIYGTLTQTGCEKVMDCMHELCGLDRTSILVDIGAGLGRPLVHALFSPGVQQAYGVEVDKVKCDKAKAFCEQTMVEMAHRQRVGPGWQVPVIMHGNIEMADTLEPCTHAFSFWEGIPVSARQAFGRLFCKSSTLKGVVVIQRSFRKENPELIMQDYGFGPLKLMSTFPVKMAGRGAQFQAYIFCRRTLGVPDSIPTQDGGHFLASLGADSSCSSDHSSQSELHLAARSPPSSPSMRREPIHQLPRSGMPRNPLRPFFSSPSRQARPHLPLEVGGSAFHRTRQASRMLTLETGADKANAKQLKAKLSHHPTQVTSRTTRLPRGKDATSDPHLVQTTLTERYRVTRNSSSLPASGLLPPPKGNAGGAAVGSARITNFGLGSSVLKTAGQGGVAGALGQQPHDHQQQQLQHGTMPQQEQQQEQQHGTPQQQGSQGAGGEEPHAPWWQQEAKMKLTRSQVKAMGLTDIHTAVDTGFTLGCQQLSKKKAKKSKQSVATTNSQQHDPATCLSNSLLSSSLVPEQDGTLPSGTAPAASLSGSVEDGIVGKGLELSVSQPKQASLEARINARANKRTAYHDSNLDPDEDPEQDQDRALKAKEKVWRLFKKLCRALPIVKQDFELPAGWTKSSGLRQQGQVQEGVTGAGMQACTAAAVVETHAVVAEMHASRAAMCTGGAEMHAVGAGPHLAQAATHTHSVDARPQLLSVSAGPYMHPVGAGTHPGTAAAAIKAYVPGAGVRQIQREEPRARMEVPLAANHNTLHASVHRKVERRSEVGSMPVADTGWQSGLPAQWNMLACNQGLCSCLQQLVPARTVTAFSLQDKPNQVLLPAAAATRALPLLAHLRPAGCASTQALPALAHLHPTECADNSLLPPPPPLDTRMPWEQTDPQPVPTGPRDTPAGLSMDMLNSLQAMFSLANAYDTQSQSNPVTSLSQAPPIPGPNLLQKATMADPSLPSVPCQGSPTQMPDPPKHVASSPADFLPSHDAVTSPGHTSMQSQCYVQPGTQGHSTHTGAQRHNMHTGAHSAVTPAVIPSCLHSAQHTAGKLPCVPGGVITTGILEAAAAVASLQPHLKIASGQPAVTAPMTMYHLLQGNTPHLISTGLTASNVTASLCNTFLDSDRPPLASTDFSTTVLHPSLTTSMCHSPMFNPGSDLPIHTATQPKIPQDHLPHQTDQVPSSPPHLTSNLPAQASQHTSQSANFQHIVSVTAAECNPFQVPSNHPTPVTSVPSPLTSPMLPYSESIPTTTQQPHIPSPNPPASPTLPTPPATHTCPHFKHMVKVEMLVRGPGQKAHIVPSCVAAGASGSPRLWLEQVKGVFTVDDHTHMPDSRSAGSKPSSTSACEVLSATLPMPFAETAEAARGRPGSLGTYSPVEVSARGRNAAMSLQSGDVGVVIGYGVCPLPDCSEVEGDAAASSGCEIRLSRHCMKLEGSASAGNGDTALLCNFTPGETTVPHAIPPAETTKPHFNNPAGPLVLQRIPPAGDNVIPITALPGELTAPSGQPLSAGCIAPADSIQSIIPDGSPGSIANINPGITLGASPSLGAQPKAETVPPLVAGSKLLPKLWDGKVLAALPLNTLKPWSTAPGVQPLQTLAGGAMLGEAKVAVGVSGDPVSIAPKQVWQEVERAERQQQGEAEQPVRRAGAQNMFVHEAAGALTCGQAARAVVPAQATVELMHQQGAVKGLQQGLPCLVDSSSAAGNQTQHPLVRAQQLSSTGQHTSLTDPQPAAAVQQPAISWQLPAAMSQQLVSTGQQPWVTTAQQQQLGHLQMGPPVGPRLRTLGGNVLLQLFDALDQQKVALKQWQGSRSQYQQSAAAAKAATTTAAKHTAAAAKVAAGIGKPAVADSMQCGTRLPRQQLERAGKRPGSSAPKAPVPKQPAAKKHKAAAPVGARRTAPAAPTGCRAAAAAAHGPNSHTMGLPMSCARKTAA